MRPAPILWYERATLLAAAIDLVNNFIALPMLARGLAIRGIVLGQPVLIASAVIAPAVGVILWYCIARRSNVIAKWLWTIYVAVSIVIFFRQMTATPLTTVNPMLIAAVTAQFLKLVSVLCLFIPTAQPWFHKELAE